MDKNSVEGFGDTRDSVMESQDPRVAESMEVDTVVNSQDKEITDDNKSESQSVTSMAENKLNVNESPSNVTIDTTSADAEPESNVMDQGNAIQSNNADAAVVEPKSPSLNISNGLGRGGDEEEADRKKTLEELEHKFAVQENGERCLRDFEDKPFNFQKYPDRHSNQKRYEELGDAITEHIYELLETECNLHKEYIPMKSENEKENKIPDSERGFIFVSENAFTTTDRLLILIHGSGVVRAGQWARRIIINDNLDSGTQLPYIRLARMSSEQREREKEREREKVELKNKSEELQSSVNMEQEGTDCDEHKSIKDPEEPVKPQSDAVKSEGAESGDGRGKYEIMVLNTNQNRYTTKDGREKDIPGSRNPEEHALYVWKNYVMGKVKAQHIAIVAHSYGGVVVRELAADCWDDFKKRVFGIAFTDSVHSFSFLNNTQCLKKVKFFFQLNARNWVTSDRALDRRLVNPYSQDDADAERYSAGTTVHEWTSDKSKYSVFEYLDEKYKERVEKVGTTEGSGSVKLGEAKLSGEGVAREGAGDVLPGGKVNESSMDQTADTISSHDKVESVVQSQSGATSQGHESSPAADKTESKKDSAVSTAADPSETSSSPTSDKTAVSDQSAGETAVSKSDNEGDRMDQSADPTQDNNEVGVEGVSGRSASEGDKVRNEGDVTGGNTEAQGNQSVVKPEPDVKSSTASTHEGSGEATPQKDDKESGTADGNTRRAGVMKKGKQRAMKRKDPFRDEEDLSQSIDTDKGDENDSDDVVIVDDLDDNMYNLLRHDPDEQLFGIIETGPREEEVEEIDVIGAVQGHEVTYEEHMEIMFRRAEGNWDISDLVARWGIVQAPPPVEQGQVMAEGPGVNWQELADIILDDPEAVEAILEAGDSDED